MRMFILLVVVGGFMLLLKAMAGPVPATPPTAGAQPASVAYKAPVPDDPTLAEARGHVRALIGQFGLNCQQVENITNLGDGPYGLEFQVLCSTGLFQVISRPHNQWMVTTWANRLK